MPPGTFTMMLLLFSVTTPAVNGEPIVNDPSAPDCQVILPEIKPLPPKAALDITVTVLVPVAEPLELLAINVPLLTMVLPVYVLAPFKINVPLGAVLFTVSAPLPLAIALFRVTGFPFTSRVPPEGLMVMPCEEISLLEPPAH